MREIGPFFKFVGEKKNVFVKKDYEEDFCFP